MAASIRLLKQYLPKQILPQPISRGQAETRVPGRDFAETAAVASLLD
jgi:hypothetical protein